MAGGSDYATGMGHMSDVPVAAFDPIFWLHHVSVSNIAWLRNLTNIKQTDRPLVGYMAMSQPKAMV